MDFYTCSIAYCRDLYCASSIGRNYCIYKHRPLVRGALTFDFRLGSFIGQTLGCTRTVIKICNSMIRICKNSKHFVMADVIPKVHVFRPRSIKSNMTIAAENRKIFDAFVIHVSLFFHTGRYDTVLFDRFVKIPKGTW